MWCHFDILVRQCMLFTSLSHYMEHSKTSVCFRARRTIENFKSKLGASNKGWSSNLAPNRQLARTTLGASWL